MNDGIILVIGIIGIGIISHISSKLFAKKLSRNYDKRLFRRLERELGQN